ncbi:MAG: S-ribosylhomocysteine lyase [Fusobacteriaceae bacterium]
MQKVESFELDHTKVKAPYVRKCALMKGEKGDYVTKFDLRFVQPNKSELDNAGLHGLEHLLAYEIRKHIDGIIDLSPMGCRTGYYLSMWGDISPKDVKEALEKSLTVILDAKEIPAANEVQCGNYRDLSLDGAKDIARKVLAQGFEIFKAQ